ncbi:geranylgeranyl reductase family protein [Dermacoccus nishinomiyaensis]|uniref:geranylgeranyl reductase family protein n=1 Tax=Dermacoccus nishinomiyaensis TaxID=1274 RepID=UPI001F50621C|nr:geranylgeranyl reductase family protein [Dermacoccus nishinomiyaensis]
MSDAVSTRPEAAIESADVIVVGAGPGGSTMAAYLAQAGLDVLLLEKTRFPREKVCGDGLTPRAVKEIDALGIPTPESEGWIRNKGLRLVGRGMRLQVDWPDEGAFPAYGLVRTRQDFDDILAQHAVAQGARLLQGVNVTAPVVENGRVAGVEAKLLGEDGRATGEKATYRAPLVVACDGNSSRLALAVGREKREDRPMGVAVRAYYTSPRTHDDYLESWLELPSTNERGEKILLPGYGWIFGVGDGTSNVGLGILNTSKAFGKTDYREVMRRWVATMPPEWTFGDATMVGDIRGAALPMGFNRTPHYADGLMLVGDSGGMVNPFNGEGIAYAMEAARLGSSVVADAFGAAKNGGDVARERILATYPDVMKQALGGYFTLGRHFATMIGNPQIMKLAVTYGLPREDLMKIIVKVMANLADPGGKSATDRLYTVLTRLAPNA